MVSDARLEAGRSVNAWGGLYDGLFFPRDRDDLVPARVCEIAGIDRYRAPIVLEGGSVHVDGEGTLITTEECLLSPGRNPQLSRESIEERRREYLGIQTVIWLDRGFDADETNGHVDDVCCFARPGEVILAWPEDAAGFRLEIQQENLARLQGATDARGRRLTVHKLPVPADAILTEEEAWGIDQMPGAKPRRAGDRAPATYVNFYLCNGGLVVPVFDDPNDEPALRALRAIFPDREVVPVPGRELVISGGNVHCITQQQPAPQPS